jgi:hypothetical protein
MDEINEKRANPKDPAGEIFDLGQKDEDVVDTEDGGAIVKINDEPLPGDSPFYANLAENMSVAELSVIGVQLCDLIERDKEARKRRDEQYEEGLRRTGLGDDAPGGASFTGASRVVHPMLTEACVDFSSRMMKEVFPPGGPAKERVFGEPTKDKFEKAQRIARFMNWQMTRQMPEFRAEMEQMSTQMPLGGVQYLKLTWDSRRKRPTPTFVSVDDVYLPFAATNFYSAERKTHVQYITKLEYQKRVASGMYLDVDLSPAPVVPDASKSETANNKIEGRSGDTYNPDGLRTIFEVYVQYDVEDGPSPYIITVDKATQQVLSIYRNWDEDDELREELTWIIEFPFVPWRGAYPIGLTHMIGGLSAAATGALRALLDSGHINNFPGLLKLKGGNAGGETTRVDPTEVHEIEGSFGQDDIRKLMMPLPFNPPSQVLFTLLGFLVDSAKGVVRTTFEELSDTNANVPVGTTLARMEQGMVVFSSIHARVHDAMARMLETLYRINKMYLDENEIYDDTGELLAYRNDFNGPVNVMPVSDPNIYSEMQRFAQIQAVVSRAQALPELYDVRAVEQMLLKQLKIPEGDSLLLPKPEVKEMNAVNENLAASMSRPVAAFPEQDHLAHLQVHLDFMRSPVLGSNKLAASTALPLLLDHCREHMILWYVEHMINVTSEAAGVDVGLLLKNANKEERAEFDRMLAAASQSVINEANSTMEQIPAIIDELIQFMQSVQPPPPPDPAAEVAQAEIQRKTQADATKAQVDQAKLQTEQAKLQQRQQESAAELQQKLQALQMQLQEAQMREQREDARTQAEIAARMKMNADDNTTAKQLAALEVAAGERIAVSTGTGINPNP